MGSLMAGAAISNISPRLGVSINGGMADHFATDIHDELSARILVLDAEDEPVVIGVIDSCMIPREILDAAKHLAHGHTGILPERMLLSATHSPSCPTVAGVFQSDPDDDYIVFLIERIADGIRRAAKNVTPAKVGYGVGALPSQVFNRRWKMKDGAIAANPFGVIDRVQMNPPAGSANLVEPAGPTDPGVTVLSVTDENDAPLALFANYSLHYVGGVPGGAISADYFGFFCEDLVKMLGSKQSARPFVPMLSNGTSGNINNINFRRQADPRAPYEQARRVARDLAEEVVRVFKNIEHQSQGKIGSRLTKLTQKRRLPTADDVAQAERILGRGEGDLKTMEEIYARETILMKDWPSEIELLLQTMKIGDLALATTPCETFVETGLAIKEASPAQPVAVVSLANGYAGYLPTEAHHQLGGYETWRARSSFLEMGAERQVRETLLEMLEKLA